MILDRVGFPIVVLAAIAYALRSMASWLGPRITMMVEALTTNVRTQTENSNRIATAVETLRDDQAAIRQVTEQHRDELREIRRHGVTINRRARETTDDERQSSGQPRPA